jgi:hypothetical protein
MLVLDEQLLGRDIETVLHIQIRQAFIYGASNIPHIVSHVSESMNRHAWNIRFSMKAFVAGSRGDFARGTTRAPFSRALKDPFGLAILRIRLTSGRIRLAELHWCEAHGIGRKEKTENYGKLPKHIDTICHLSFQ